MKHFMNFRSALLILLIPVVSGCSGSAEDPGNGILVSTDWVQEQMSDPDLILLHSGTAELYDSIHIPGARLIDPYTFTTNAEGVHNELPEADSIVELLKEVGVQNDSRIVLYHEDISLLNRTARVFLSLDHLGLGEQTMLLNGGLTAWIEQGLETTDVPADFPPGRLKLPGLKKVTITAAELEQERWNDEVVVIDARSDEDYYGTPGIGEDPAEGGHIEGAYSLSYLDITSDDSPYLFRTEKDLVELFKEAEMDPEKVTLIYCDSGIKGSLNYLAARHLGYQALLYDGSIEEWEELGLPHTGPVPLPINND